MSNNKRSKEKERRMFQLFLIIGTLGGFFVYNYVSNDSANLLILAGILLGIMVSISLWRKE